MIAGSAMAESPGGLNAGHQKMLAGASCDHAESHAQCAESPGARTALTVRNRIWMSCVNDQFST